MIIKLFFTLYLYIALAVVAHEIFHLIAGLICFKHVEKVVLGWEKVSIPIGRLIVSPVIFSGRVEIDCEYINNSSKYKKIFFFLSGVGANIILLVFFTAAIKLGNNNIITVFSVAFNLICIAANLLPIEQNDMGVLLYMLKYDEGK